MIPRFIPTNLWPASGYCWKFWNKDRSDSIGEKLGSKIDERNGFNKYVTRSNHKEKQKQRISHTNLNLLDIFGKLTTKEQYKKFKTIFTVFRKEMSCTIQGSFLESANKYSWFVALIEQYIPFWLKFVNPSKPENHDIKVQI